MSEYPPVVHNLNSILGKADERLARGHSRRAGVSITAAREWVRHQPIMARLAAGAPTEEIDAPAGSDTDAAPEGSDKRSHALDKIAKAELREKGIDPSNIDAYVDAVEKADRALGELGV